MAVEITRVAAAATDELHEPTPTESDVFPLNPEFIAFGGGPVMIVNPLDDPASSGYASEDTAPAQVDSEDSAPAQA